MPVTKIIICVGLILYGVILTILFSYGYIITGALMLLIMLISGGLLLLREQSLYFNKVILCTIPVLGLLFYWATIKLSLLILPVAYLVYRMKIISGFKYIMSDKNIFSSGIMLMLIGVGLSIVNVIITKSFSMTMLMNIGVIFFGGIIYLITLTSVNSKEELYSLMSIIPMLILVLTIYIILYVIYSNIYMLLYQGKTFNLWIFSMNANAVAMVLVPLTILIMPSLFIQKKNGRDLASFIIFYAAAISIILSNSRGAWIGFLIGLFYIFTRLKKVKTVIIALVFVAIIVFFISDIVIARYNQTNLRDYSILIRFWIWVTALRYFINNPILGLGPDAFRLEKYKWGFPSYFDPSGIMSTHNIFLETLVNYGVFFLIGFLIVIFYLYIEINKIHSRCNNSVDKMNLIAVNAALLGFLVHNVFDCGMSNVGILTVIVFLFSFATIIVKRTYWFIGDRTDANISMVKVNV